MFGKVYVVLLRKHAETIIIGHSIKELRYSFVATATENIIEQFRRIQNFVISKQGSLKFITVPVYSAIRYNSYLGHPHAESFEATDKSIKE